MPDHPVTPAQLNQPLYYIASQYAPCGNCISWWCKDGAGYTCDLKQAWKVPLEQAKSICSDPDRREKYYPCEEIDKLAVLHFDFQLLRNLGKVS